jgi:tRNA-dihydrouridine synthase B
MVDTPPTFYVRDIPIYGDLILSPMEGFSDLPFRSLCRELGSAMSYTEFINVLDIMSAWQRIQMKLSFLPQERPVVFQIFDSEPVRILQAALQLQSLPPERRPDIIDINMGCSDRSVSARGAGAGLLRTPDKVAQIFSMLSRSLEIPVTGKIRLGWNTQTRNYLEIAHIVEDNGGSLVAVHGRTRHQGYTGEADWDAIAEVRQALTIPVVGNGDVCCVADIERMKSHTGCPAVMIGRAAIGNPWIFARLDRDQVNDEQVRHMVQRHLERMMAFYGDERGLVIFRKHASRYLKAWNLPREQRQQLFTTATAVEFVDFLATLKS